VTEHRVQRRLAAILAADVVGYSALMERAEEATYAEFERLKCEVIELGLSRHNGRLIKTTGDGALAEFASPSAAVRCASSVWLAYIWASERSNSAWAASLFSPARRSDPNARLGWFVIVGTIPIAVLGAVFQHSIETSLRDLRITGTVLILFGLVLAVADRKAE